MAGNVKGIVVEIGGDTSGLQKALKDVNKNISSISRELSGVNTLLKLDPKNTTLLTQKQKLLNYVLSSFFHFHKTYTPYYNQLVLIRISYIHNHDS